MDVSPDHEPTLIERGTNVHLNHPITAQRGIHDSRPTRWESWTPHPSVPQKDGEGAYGQDGELALIASIGPRLGGSTHGTLSSVHRTQTSVDACAQHRRGRLKHC
jgi:hypothetical protein